MDLVSAIENAWGWTGIKPAQVVGDNDFGNLIVKDTGGRFWRLCPADLYCKVVAESRAELNKLSNDQAFLRDWYMTALVEQARVALGTLPPGFKYCLKVSGVLGGEYGGENLAVMSFVELIRASGHIAKEIAHLADGTQVGLEIVE